MFNKPKPSLSLRTLQSLSCRKRLISEEKMRKRHLERGFEGEQKLYALLQEKLRVPCISLYGLQLSHHMHEFQIDCVLISHHAIHLLEVKNYYGDFTVDDDRWYHVATMDEIKNPLLQLTRCKRLLTSWLQKRNITFPVISHVIFMNPHFYLYGADVSMPIIFPAQHETYLNKLNKNTRPLHAHHEQIASTLTASHIVQSRHEYIPAYGYDDLQKGIYCKQCATPLKKAGEKFFTCRQCGTQKEMGASLLHAVKEFQLLFPDRSLTVKKISHWTGNMLSKNTIRNYLANHFTRCSRGRGTYYR